MRTKYIFSVLLLWLMALGRSYAQLDITWPANRMSVPSMSPVGTEGMLIALVVVLGNKLRAIKIISKKTSPLNQFLSGFIEK